MMLLQAKGISHSIGVKELLKGVDVEVHRGERIGLIGANGEGKSTMMKLLAGLEQPEEGMVIPYGKIAYVPQSLEADGGTLVEEWLAARNVVPQPLLVKEFGLREDVWARPLGSLSGGEQTKIALLAALSEEPELLLLDEPTNHLDLEAVQWLERTLRGLKIGMLVISHDRRFLDEVTTVTWELKQGKVTVFPGSYRHYAAWVEQERARVEKQYEEYLKEHERLEEAIRRKTQWAEQANKGRRATDTFARILKASDQARAAKMSRGVKAIEKRLESLEPKEKPERRLWVNPKFLQIDLSQQAVLVRGEGITFGYGERVLLDQVDFEVERSDRIALVGPNGVGKSTLLKLLSGAWEPQRGRLRVTPSATLGYFDQVFAELDLGRSLLDDLLLLDGVDATTARLFLGSFLFRNDEVFKPLSALSYGERVRYVFVKLILSRANTLVLDEPSNHLDLATREKLEEALLEYPGAIVVASHDRHFLEKMTNKVWEIRDGKLTVHPFGYREYVERRQAGEVLSAAGSAAAVAEKKGKKSKREMKEELLRIETRLAQLSWELMTVSDAGKKLEMDEEYLQLSRERNRLRREIG
jgi:ATPase subunit of ABC transporter with duplicated ATPase domains